jgi:hypothetical protein
LFAGARTEEDLYDLAALTQLDRRFPWLTVIPAVSDQPSYRGHQGLVADVVGQYGPWSGFDAYVCGPPAMVAATTARLRELGIAPQSIHHEAWQADIAPDAVPVLGSDVIRRPRHQPMSYASASSGYRASEMQRHEIYSDEVLEGTVYVAAERASAPTPDPVRVIQAVPATQAAAPSPPAPMDEQSAVSAPTEPAAAPQTASDEARVRQMREMIELRRARRSLYAGRRR